MRSIADAVLDRSWPPDRRGDRVAFAAYRARFLAIDPVCYAQANAVLASADLGGAIATWPGRCHLVAGTHDLLRPPAAVAALRARMRHATMTEIAAVHLSPMQAPGAVAAEIVATLA
jgi:3-oxoadipate enol-lactonase